MERGLTPTEVFNAPLIRACIASHVSLRKSQGLGSVSTILEDQILESKIDQYLGTRIGKDRFTGEDAFHVSKIVRDYIAELVRIIVIEYAP